MRVRPEEEEEFIALPSERFYEGVIAKINRGRRTGVVRAASGREIPFNFAHVTLVGDRAVLENLQEGMWVGFDVGQTSRGLRVTVLRPMNSGGTGGSSGGGLRGSSGG